MEDEEEETFECDRCGWSTTEEDDLSYISWEGTKVCIDCLLVCSHCGDNEENGEIVEIFSHRNYSYACGDCRVSCYNCGEYLTEDSAYYATDDGHDYCGDCITSCEECGESLSPSDDYERYCRGCGGGDSIRGYDSTTPSTWYGGPVPKDPKTGKSVGYYIGFENEIWARGSRYTGRFIKEWGQANVGDDFFDCKHDGSVTGFEIATQPMTPEFFESVNWEGFFDMLNFNHPLEGGNDEEPSEHGMHVHIGRVAFDRDDIAIAMFVYLLQQDDSHLVRIARREPTHYCPKVHQPVKSAVISGHDKETAQTRRIRANHHVRLTRGAVNLENTKTIEIRAFRATRSANELRDAVRLVYVAAEYIRYLRRAKISSSNSLHWSEFAQWVAKEYPYAFNSIAGISKKGSNRINNPRQMW